MIQIKADVEVNTGGVTYRVITSGEHQDDDLVEVYRDGDKDKNSVGAFQAHYIAYGFHVGEADPREG